MDKKHIVDKKIKYPLSRKKVTRDENKKTKNRKYEENDEFRKSEITPNDFPHRNAYPQ